MKDLEKISRLENINIIAYGMREYVVMVMASYSFLGIYLFFKIKTGDIKEVTLNASNLLDNYNIVLNGADALMVISISIKACRTVIEDYEFKELILFTLGVFISSILVGVFPPLTLVILTLPWYLIGIWISHRLKKQEKRIFANRYVIDNENQR